MMETISGVVCEVVVAAAAAEDCGCARGVGGGCGGVLMC